MVRLLIAMFSLAALAVPLSGFGDCGKKPLTPEPGFKNFQAQNFAQFPKGLSVNLAGGNLLARRTDLSIDTWVGTWDVGAAYNSATGKWLHNFEMTYVDGLFIDDTGAEHDLSGLGGNERVEGTHWVKINDSTVKTLGGMVYEFDYFGNLAAAYWASNPYPRIKFVDDPVWFIHRVVSIQQCVDAASPCEDVYGITYECIGAPGTCDVPGTGEAITRITDERTGTRSAEFEYMNGNLQNAKDALDLAENWSGFQYAYNGDDLTSITNSEGEVVTIGYDAAHRATSVEVVGNPGRAWTLEYLKTKLTRVTDPDGDVTTALYDAKRRLLELTSPTGQQTQNVWHPSYTYRIATRTDAAGISTHYDYAETTTQITEPSGNVITLSFAPYSGNHVSRPSASARPLLTAVDSLGPRVTNSFDSSGRLTTTENGEAERTSFTYNGLGLVETITLPHGQVTTFTSHGNHGHARYVDNGDFVLDRTHDAVGNLTRGARAQSAYDPARPGVCERTFDANRNVASLGMDTTTNFGCVPTATITVTRRSDGRVAYVDRPYGGDHRFLYNNRGDLVERSEWVDGAWQPVLYEYHPDGARSAIEEANGMRREIDIDASGRPTQLRLVRGGNTEHSVAYTYDAFGRLTHKADSHYSDTERFSYDSAGRLTWRRFPRGESRTFTFDLRSRLSVEKIRNGAGTKILHLDRQYDLANRMVGLTDFSNPILERTYVNRQLASEAFGNGVTRTYQYDSLGRFESASSADGTGATIESTSVTREVPLGTFAWTTKTTTHTYGALPKTTVEGFTHSKWPSFGGGSVTYDEGWAVNYDALTNYAAYGYNSQRNRIWSAGSVGYDYDGAGYTTMRNGKTITWDAGGRVTSIGDDTFEWDVDGRPVSRNVGGVERQYRFGGMGYDDTSGDVGFVDVGNIRFDVGTGEILVRHRDFRGNIKFLTDAAGAVVTHYHYWNYDLRSVGGITGADIDDKTFAGGDKLGDHLYWIGARIYDGRVGRFLSQDPIFQPVNQYQYSQGNAVQFWDPDGRFNMALEPTGFGGGGGSPGGLSQGAQGAIAGQPGGVGPNDPGAAVAGAAATVAYTALPNPVGGAKGRLAKAALGGLLGYLFGLDSNSTADGSGQGTGDGQGGGGEDGSSDSSDSSGDGSGDGSGESGRGGGNGSTRNAGPASTPWDASFSGEIGGGATCAPASLPVTFSRGDLSVLLLLQLALGGVLLSSRRRHFF